jgi:hypothetical protein
MIKVVALSDKNLASRLLKLVGEPVEVRRNISEADFFLPVLEMTAKMKHEATIQPSYYIDRL